MRRTLAKRKASAGMRRAAATQSATAAARRELKAPKALKAPPSKTIIRSPTATKEMHHDTDQEDDRGNV